VYLVGESSPTQQFGGEDVLAIRLAPPQQGRLQILTSTTRWKPQRDTARDADGKALKPIRIEFSSPTPLKSATVTITGPSAVAPITETFDPEKRPNPYVIRWDGFATDDSNRASKEQLGVYEKLREAEPPGQ
jgi:hypothetical protein